MATRIEEPDSDLKEIILYNIGPTGATAHDLMEYIEQDWMFTSQLLIELNSQGLIVAEYGSEWVRYFLKEGKSD